MELTTMLRFQAAVEIQAAAEGKPPRVNILAYSGAVMTVGGWQSPVVVDLDSLKVGAMVPILGDHAATLDGVAGVGVPTIRAGTIRVEGTLTNNATGSKIVALARDGVPLQASIGVEPGNTSYIRPGDKAAVNGRALMAGERGLTVIKFGRLKEVSILPLGADPATTVAITAKTRKDMSMDPEIMTQTETDDAPPSEVSAVQCERDRVKAIRSMCRGEYRDIEARAIDEGWPIDRTRMHVLEALRASRASAPPVRRDDRPNVRPRDMLAASALLMANQEAAAIKAFGARVVEGIERPTGWPELAAMAMRLEGRDVPRGRQELLRAAFSTTDMPNALGLSVQRAMLEPFMEAASGWSVIAKPVVAQDFRGGKAIRLSAATGFMPVAPNGELQHGNLAEETHDFKVDTYGRIFGITRQALVNDDLDLLDSLPVILAHEGARKIADVFYDLLTANAGPFFASGNNNLIHGALGITELSDAIRALRVQTDRDGRIIGMVPSVLLVPAALEAEARSIVASESLSRDQSVDSQPTASPVAGLNLKVVVEPRLDANSTTDWYLFAQPMHGAVLIAYLQGKSAPVVEAVDQAPNMLGTYWRAYLDFGVALAETRAAIKSDVAPYA